MNPQLNLPISVAIARALLLATLLFSLPHGASAQSDIEKLLTWGLPRSEIYFGNQTGISGDIKHITNLPGGEVAFLTTVGVFVFDGTNWSQLPELNWTTNSLTLSETEMAVSHSHGVSIYEIDGKGGYSHRSITPPDKYDFNITPIESMAQARGYLFGLTGSDLISVAPDGDISHHQLPNWATSCFAIEDELYLTGGTSDLLNRWDWKTQRLVNATSLLDRAGIYEWIVANIPRKNGGVWLLTIENKIIGFDGQQTWSWPGNEYLERNNIRVNTFTEGAPDSLALSTVLNGLLVFNHIGNFEFKYSKEQGLDNVEVTAIGSDPEGGIWLSTLNSITRVPATSRLTVFNAVHGLPSAVEAIAIFNDQLYAGTANGLYVSNPQARLRNETFKLALKQGEILDILVHEGHLLVGGEKLSIIDSQGRKNEVEGFDAISFFQPKGLPGTVLVCDSKGVYRLDFSDGTYRVPQRLAGPKVHVHSLAQNKEGELFGSLADQRFARIYLGEQGGYYELHEALDRQTDMWTSLVTIDGDVYMSDTPCLRWDTTSNSFVTDPQMHYYVGTPPYGFQQVYGTSDETAVVAENGRRSTTVPRPPRQTIGDISTLGNSLDTRAMCIEYDEKGNVWAGGPFGLAYVTIPKQEKDEQLPRPAIHRIVSMADGEVFPTSALLEAPLILESHQNSLNITVEYPKFGATTHHRFQIHLGGFDGEWQDFSSKKSREFTNLKPGSYTLMINARDATGRSSLSHNYYIVILKPWHLTTIAFVLYAIIAILVISAIVYGYNRRQIQRSHLLERLVVERTKEIEQKNQELEQQADRLEKQNEQLADKTEELTATTEILTETLTQLHQMQDQLVFTARTAGKAEIAINVLHNVGNVLNSLNVSINVLAQKAEVSKATKLTRLADLISHHKEDLSDFISNDPKGKNVPNYLIQLSGALNEEIDSVKHELAVMAEDLDHVKRIISAQQTHARSESAFETVNLYELSHNAITILDDQISQDNHEIINEIPENLVIENDKHRLLEILLNLLSNARDAIREHAPEIGVISLSVEISEDQNTLDLKIKDNGIGISAETQEKLFRHGFTTKNEGHGFGLHSCANAAQALGGKLTLESPGVGHGATAILTLPMKAVATR